MSKFLRAVLATLLLASCVPPVDFEFEAKSEHLSAKATITEIEWDFRDGFTKLSGNVAISNTSAQRQNYSNMWLWLRSGDEVRERAWLNNLTSHYIDEGEVEIEAGDTLELEVYWVFPESEIEELGDEAFALEIRSTR